MTVVPCVPPYAVHVEDNPSTPIFDQVGFEMVLVSQAEI